MKRTLSLVLALVMLLGTIPVFAAEVDERIAFLEAEGLLKGNTAGDLMLNAELKRQDSVVVLARLLGLEEAALAYEGEFPWEDAKADPFYFGFLAWAYEEGLYKGHSDEKFGFNETITANDFALVLWRALGYEDPAVWSDAFDAAKGLGLVEGLDLEATDKLLRSNMAIMMYLALGTEMAEGGKTLAEVLGVEMPGVEMMATQTGARKITVTFNKAVDEASTTFEVSRGSVKPSVKSVDFADDNKSAVVEFNLALAAGEYTVKATVGEVVLTGTVTAVAAKLNSIEFTGDVLVIANAPTNTQVRVGVVAKNQFGEEVTVTPQVSSSKGTGSVSNGVLTLTSPTPYVVNEVVVVTAVDSNTGVVVSKSFTVAQAAQVATIVIGDIRTDDTTLAAKPFNVTNLNADATKFYIPVQIKDQYGNVLKAAELTGVNILSSNTSIINPKGFKDVVNVGTVIELQAATGTSTSGTVVLTIVASGTGASANKVITVLADAKIDMVTLSAPTTELKLGKAAVLPITIVDSYGNEVALKDVAVGGTSTAMTFNTNSTLTATGATLAEKMNYTTGVRTIEITPTSKNIILTVISETNKFQSLSLVALDAPVASSLNGMKATFVSTLANDVTMSTVIDNTTVNVLDQYGEAITGATLEVVKKSGTATTTSGALTVTATTTPGTDVFTVNLKNSSGTVIDTMDVSVVVVDKNKITAFGIEDLNKFYTGANSARHNQQVEIYGLVGANKVEVPQSMVKLVTANNGLVISTSGAFTAKLIDTNNQDVGSRITVLIEAGTNTYTVTKDVVYNSANPIAQSLMFKKGTAEVNNTVEVTLAAGNLFEGIDGFKVVAKDQYNVDVITGAFVVTNNETGATISVANNGTLTLTGTPVVGKSFLLNAFVDGLFKSIKVFVK